MPRIATCTSCIQQVTLPQGVDQNERVRCPICNAQYELSEVDTDTFEADQSDDLPPELTTLTAASPETVDAESIDIGPPPDSDAPSAIDTAPDIDITLDGQGAPDVETAPQVGSLDVDSVDVETAPRGEEKETEEPEASSDGEEGEEASEADSSDGLTIETDDSEGDSETDEAEEPVEEPAEAGDETEESAPEAAATDKIEEEPVLRVRCPTCEAEHPLSEMVLVDTGEPFGPDVAAAVARALSADQAAPSGEGAAGVPGLDVWAKADSAPQLDLGQGVQAGAPTADAGAFRLGGEAASGDSETSVMEGMARRRERQKGGWRTLVGPIVGGIAGLVIAYYLLNLIRGEAGNFLKIPLPGVSHTYRYSPGWFPGFLQPSADDASQSEDETIEFDSLVIPALPVPTDYNPPAVPQPSEKTPEVAHAEEPPPKEKKTFPDGYVGLVDPPSYTSDELGKALEAADASVKDAEGPISEEAYRKLCRLAEMATFVDGGKGAKQLGARRSAIRTLLEQIGQTPANLDKIGFQAGALCVNRDRRESGVVLAGKVLTTVSEGKAHGAQVQLAASGRTITVASKRPLGAAADDDVLILGRIVNEPAENLVGFPTKQPVVVWAGMTVKVK